MLESKCKMAIPLSIGVRHKYKEDWGKMVDLKYES
jgi:hypothetical protein